MSAFWIFAGCVALCAPHLAAAQQGVTFAWSGLPYTGELVALLVVAMFCRTYRIPERYEHKLPVATLAATTAMLAFEATATATGAFAAHFLPLAVAEEVLHAASVALWLMCAANKEDAGQRQCRLVWPVACAFFLSGATWYLTTEAMRATAAWVLNAELTMWVTTLLWAASLVLALWMCKLNRRAFWTCAAAPFAGVFVGNRIWIFALRFGFKLTWLPTGLPALLSGGVLSLLAAILLWALMRTKVPNEQNAFPSEASEQPTLPAQTELPLHLLSGYQTLSSRERQVLLRTLEGATAAEVSKECGLSTSTVRTYRARAYEKLGTSGPEEVLASLRLAIEQPVPMPAEPTKDMSPAMRTWSERMAPPLGCLAVGCLASAVFFFFRYQPSHLMRTAGYPVVFILVLTAGLVVCWRGPHTSHEHEWRPFAVAVLMGSCCAVALAAIALGAYSFALRRTIVASLVIAASTWIVYRARVFDASAPGRTLAFAGLVGVALVPHGANVGTLLRSFAPTLMCTALLLLAAGLLQSLVRDQMAELASVALKGDARVLAYLEGRGLPSLQAEIALLTARDYPLGGIAATVHVSQSAVSQSRMRTYRSLGVANKDELIELLQRDAGLDCSEDVAYEQTESTTREQYREDEPR